MASVLPSKPARPHVTRQKARHHLGLVGQRALRFWPTHHLKPVSTHRADPSGKLRLHHEHHATRIIVLEPCASTLSRGVTGGRAITTKTHEYPHSLDTIASPWLCDSHPGRVNLRSHGVVTLPTSRHIVSPDCCEGPCTLMQTASITAGCQVPSPCTPCLPVTRQKVETTGDTDGLQWRVCGRGVEPVGRPRARSSDADDPLRRAQ